MTAKIPRQWMALPALAITAGAFYLIVTYLQDYHSTKTIMEVSLVGTCFSMVLAFAWAGLGRWAALVMTVVGIVLMWFPLASIPYAWFLGYFAWFGIVFLLLHLAEKGHANRMLVEQMLVERNVEERNRIFEQAQRRKVTIQALRQKYETHLNLKSVAEEFASTLSLNQLADLIARKTAQVMRDSEVVLVYLVDPGMSRLSLVSSMIQEPTLKIQSKEGDLFDHWVLKHRQPLLVADIQNDFRFDVRDKFVDSSMRCLLTVPMINEGRVIGILRVSRHEPESLNTDDLRVLSILAVLASSALTNSVLYQRTEELAISDSLTGLYVQRYFRERFEENHKRCTITHTPYSVLMCDLDHFKQINDRYGHAAGDMVLKSVASTFKEEISDAGLVARYGGEEFVIILYNTDKADAGLMGERLRKQVERLRVSMRGLELETSVSIGVATFPQDAMDAEELLRKADQALYDAKRQGRNKVCYVA